jgi:hypothetical protein
VNNGSFANHPSSACISWIHLFLSERKIKLAFNNKIINNLTNLYIEISQNLSVSSILFLIYISQLFKNNLKLAARLISYSDNIIIIVSLKTIL